MRASTGPGSLTVQSTCRPAYPLSVYRGFEGEGAYRSALAAAAAEAAAADLSLRFTPSDLRKPIVAGGEAGCEAGGCTGL